MAIFEMDSKEMERLCKTVENFPDTAIKSINSILYEEAPELITEAIKKLMPVSGANWKGKNPAAKSSGSIKERSRERRNLSIVVGTVSDYHYLYFPDDGTNTYRHAGNQRFFERGGQESSAEIVDRCITRIIDDFSR